jgi:hypothetical protein
MKYNVSKTPDAGETFVAAAPFGKNIAFVSDREEGLVVVNVATLVDGNPDNNFLKEKETVRFNPNGVLNGATFVAAAGVHVIVAATPSDDPTLSQ